jgi:hypothetical protein
MRPVDLFTRKKATVCSLSVTFHVSAILSSVTLAPFLDAYHLTTGAKVYPTAGVLSREILSDVIVQ